MGPRKMASNAMPSNQYVQSINMSQWTVDNQDSSIKLEKIGLATYESLMLRFHKTYGVSDLTIEEIPAVDRDRDGVL